MRDILIETRRRAVENPDAVDFVQRISAMHGTAIPGFGEEKVSFLLKLILDDSTERVIYDDSNMEDVLSAYDEIREYLKIHMVDIRG